MRDKLIHDYFCIAHNVVWKTVKQDVSGLILTLEPILLSLEAEENRNAPDG